MSRTAAILLSWIVVTMLSAVEVYTTSVNAYCAAEAARVAQPAPHAHAIVCRGLARALLASEASLTAVEHALVERALATQDEPLSAADLTALRALWEKHCTRGSRRETDSPGQPPQTRRP